MMTTEPRHRMIPSSRRFVRLTLQAEGAGLAAICAVAYVLLGGGWGLFALLILAPDILMVGYLLGPGIGAHLYNAAHSTLGPAALGAAAYVTGWDNGVLAALIWVAHIGLDRSIGYGLKYPDHFHQTHLGRV